MRTVHPGSRVGDGDHPDRDAPVDACRPGSSGPSASGETAPGVLQADRRTRTSRRPQASFGLRSQMAQSVVTPVTARKSVLARDPAWTPAPFVPPARDLVGSRADFVQTRGAPAMRVPAACRALRSLGQGPFVDGLRSWARCIASPGRVGGVSPDRWRKSWPTSMGVRFGPWRVGASASHCGPHARCARRATCFPGHAAPTSRSSATVWSAGRPLRRADATNAGGHETIVG